MESNLTNLYKLKEYIGKTIYSPIYGNVVINSVTEDKISVEYHSIGIITFDIYGRMSPDGEPMLFPDKNKSSWNVFFRNNRSINSSGVYDLIIDLESLIPVVDKIVTIIQTCPYIEWKKYDSLDCIKTIYHDNIRDRMFIDPHIFINQLSDAVATLASWNISYEKGSYSKTLDEINEYKELYDNLYNKINETIIKKCHACNHTNAQCEGHDSHKDYYVCPDCGHEEWV